MEMKQTLQSKYGAAVAPFLTDGVMGRDDYSTTIKALHTQAVAKSIEDLGANHLTGAAPLPIDDSELSLSRHERATLAQLRSGDCHFLKDYQMRIGKADDATCPECKYRRHSVPHIFECDAAPTVLRVTDLWAHPVAVANHLRKLSSFSSLAQRDPPIPHPPPEPAP